MKNQLNMLNINNAERIEYPYFSIIQPDKIKAKEYFDLKNNVPVLCCLGSARYDKGLDILLDSLKNVKEDFQLLIAGTTSKLAAICFNSSLRTGSASFSAISSANS